MRWLEPEVIAAATAEPVTVAEAQIQCRIEPTDGENTAILAGLIAAARGYVEQVTGLKLAAQTLKLRAWDLSEATFSLPIAPVSAISGITYMDANGVQQTLDPALYTGALYGLSPTISRAYDQNWPAHRCGLGYVTITVTAGYASGACPEPIKQAILLTVGDWFANRETSTEGRFSSIEMVAVDALLANFRRAYV